MNATARKSFVPIVIFLAYAIFAYTLAPILVHTIPESHRAILVSVALPLDLMIGLPTLFYFLVIRRLKLPLAFLMPVIGIGWLFVFNVAKPENMTAMFVIATVAVAAELSIGLSEFRRIGKVFLEAKRASDDPRDWFFLPSNALVRNKKATAYIVAELTMAYYTFFSWRKKPLVPHGAQAFTYHKETAFIYLMVFLICFSPVEIIALHLLISIWNPVVAWVVTVLTVYTLLYLLGDVRATILRPITVSATTLGLNLGLRLSAKIPLPSIESVSSKDPGFSKGESLDMSAFGSANTWITFKEPVEVEMLFGIKKKVKAIVLTVDNASLFHKALTESVKS